MHNIINASKILENIILNKTNLILFLGGVLISYFGFAISINFYI